MNSAPVALCRVRSGQAVPTPILNTALDSPAQRTGPPSSLRVKADARGPVHNAHPNVARIANAVHTKVDTSVVHRAQKTITSVVGPKLLQVRSHPWPALRPQCLKVMQSDSFGGGLGPQDR
jgi:hypothetical protein